MATFPNLKTGVAAQYPLDRSVRFQTQSVKFLDGSQQRYRIQGAGLRRWSISLDLLDEQELASLVAFVEQQGSAAFAFTDPVTGENIAKCVMAGDRFEAFLLDETRAGAKLSIEEIP